MKEQILQLRAEGRSYREIKNTLGCSKSLISYYCGAGQKEKNIARMQTRRKDTVISGRTERFQHQDRKKQLKDKAIFFQRERKGGKPTKISTFRWQDVIDKFGWETICYLTGRPINLREPRAYQFDHKIPYSKGGTSDLSNLGIACKEANIAKADKTPEEFIMLCKEVLEFNGYEVKRSGSMNPVVERLKYMLGGAEPHKYFHVLSILIDVIENHLDDGEQVLLDLLRYEGELNLDENAEMPHSMSPEKMLKSITVQGLIKKTGLKHVEEIKKLDDGKAGRLQCIIRGAIKQHEQLAEGRPAESPEVQQTGLPEKVAPEESQAGRSRNENT